MTSYHPMGHLAKWKVWAWLHNWSALSFTPSIVTLWKSWFTATTPNPLLRISQFGNFMGVHKRLLEWKTHISNWLGRMPLHIKCCGNGFPACKVSIGLARNRYSFDVDRTGMVSYRTWRDIMISQDSSHCRISRMPLCLVCTPTLRTPTVSVLVVWEFNREINGKGQHRSYVTSQCKVLGEADLSYSRNQFPVIAFTPRLLTRLRILNKVWIELNLLECRINVGIGKGRRGSAIEPNQVLHQPSDWSRELSKLSWIFYNSLQVGKSRRVAFICHSTKSGSSCLRPISL